MPVDLGLDNLLDAATKRYASGFRKRIEDLIEAAFKSDRNAFETGATITAAQLNPLSAGQQIEYAGDTVPTGFLECNGAEVRASDYPDLFAAIGSTYGTAQAAGHFKLPDLRGASVTGAGGTRSAGPGTAVGDTHDSDTVTLAAANLPRHRHAVSQTSDSAGAHTHNWTKYPNVAINTGIGGQHRDPRNDHLFGLPGVSYGEFSDDAATGTGGGHVHATFEGDIDDAGSGTALTVQQPSLAVMMLIKT